MAATPGNGSQGGDLLGRLSVAEVEIRNLREADGRIDAEIQRQRDRWHSLGNIVNGFAEVERTVDVLQQSVRDLQVEVRSLRSAIDKLQGPGGAIEQLNSLAEDRRFRKRLLGWAAAVGFAAASAWAFVEKVAPYLKLPTKP